MYVAVAIIWREWKLVSKNADDSIQGGVLVVGPQRV
jgi:hypothetical protein